MTTKRLELLPDSEGYSIEQGAGEYVTNKLEGGFSARRRDLENVTKFASVQWTVSPKKYDYLCKFYEEWCKEPDWFDVLLVDEIAVAEYPLQNFKAMFIPDTFGLTSVKGYTYTVSARLEVYLDNPYPMSTVYPIAAYEQIALVSGSVESGFFWRMPSDDLSLSGGFLESGTLAGAGNVEYAFNEQFLVKGGFFKGGKLEKPPPQKYKFGDGFSVKGAFIKSGTLKAVLIKYDNYEPEGFDVKSGFLKSGEFK